MNKEQPTLGSLTKGTMVHIKHLGEAKYLRINEYRMAVIEYEEKEMTIMQDVKFETL